jgi:hypothetical protein
VPPVVLTPRHRRCPPPLPARYEDVFKVHRPVGLSPVKALHVVLQGLQHLNAFIEAVREREPGSPELKRVCPPSGRGWQGSFFLQRTAPCASQSRSLGMQR